MTSIDEREQRYAEAVDDAAPRNRVRRVMALADAERAELRAEIQTLTEGLEANQESYDDTFARAEAAEAKVARVEALAEAWGDWPITAQGQAADLLRDIRAALDGDA